MNQPLPVSLPAARFQLLRSLAIVILAVVALSAKLPAQGDPGSLNSERTFGNGVLSHFLALYDVDDSGGLSVEELQAMQNDRALRHQRLRDRWDLDRDGVISAQEREQAKARIQQIIQQRRSMRFDEVDANADGFLTEAEFLSIAAVVSTDEESPGIGVNLFQNLDADDDNLVSKDEFLRKLNTTVPVVPIGDGPRPHPESDSDGNNGTNP